MTDVLSTHTPEQFAFAVARAADVLRAGDVVALPTETVYGLAANAFDAQAVARIYAIKGRPAHNPIIVHVASMEMALACVAVWPESASSLAQSFWPGPLTLVLPRAPIVPDIVTAAGATVGVRWPSHPFIQAVIRACGFPLAAPSANLSNAISPTTAEHVRRHLGRELSLIVDGGSSEVGIESTVIDLSRAPARVLRPGMIHEAALAAALATQNLGEVEVDGDGHMDPSTLRSPGLLEKHYAPRARLVMCHWQDTTDLGAQIDALGVVRSHVHVLAHTRVPPPDRLGGVSILPRDPAAYARVIYAELHRCDDAGAELIVIEETPEVLEWRGLRDRLSRAAAGQQRR
jgi:L-threonylcarbamoyladenylate synthase